MSGHVYTQPRTRSGLARFLKAWRRPALGSEIWATRPSYRIANGKCGMCNTGADARGVCALGGIGCNVDHSLIAACNGVSLEAARFPRTLESLEA